MKRRLETNKEDTAMAEKFKSKKSSLDAILECPICLFQLKQPYTLQECLHSFCKDCIEAVPKKICDGHCGWVCPQCRNFTKEDSIKHNFFINDLLDIHNKKDEVYGIEKILCKQCPQQPEATWKCADCRFQLCDNCQLIHLKIPMLKGHRVIPLDAEMDQVVDRLIFCPIHDDKPIEFNCKPCELPLCIKCKVIEHDGHKTETVEMALERLLPKMEENNAKLEQNGECIKKQIAAISAKIDEVTENYAYCRTEVNEQAKKLTEQIKRIRTTHEATLAQQETIALKGLEETKQQLENKLSEVTNLTSLVAASTAKAKHISLLNEIQGGLMKKVKENGEKEQQNVAMEIKEAKFSVSKDNKQEKMKELQKLFGELKFQSIKAVIAKHGGEELPDYMCDNIMDVISKEKTKEKQIQLPEWCNRISYIDGKLWLCFKDLNQIKVFSTNGDLLQTIDTTGHKFLVVKKASNGHFVAGGEDGLYVTQAIGSNWTKLTAADSWFSDLCVHGDSVSALDVTAKKVITVTCHSQKLEQWKITNSIQITTLNLSNYCETIIFQGNHFLICSINNKAIHKYSTTGQCVHKHTTKYDYPLLCCGDEAGNVVVNFIKNHKTLCLLQANQDGFTEKDTNVTLDGVQGMRDLVVDKDHNIWVLSGGSPYYITKYTTDN